LCSDHFAPECFRRSLGGNRVYLNDGAIPTIFNFNKEKPARKAPLDRSQSAVKSTCKQQPCTSITDLELNETAEHDDIQCDIHLSLSEKADENTTTIAAEILNEESQHMQYEHTDISQEHTLLIAQLEESVQAMKNELISTKERLERRITELEEEVKKEKVAKKTLEQQISKNAFNVDNLKNNNKLFKFYTGFQNYEVFTAVLNFFGREAASKLDYGNKEVMAQEKKVKPGPERALSVENEFFLLLREIFIEKPSNPEAQQLTFSSYKNSNTLKALIGITPSGSVCFVSELYGGSISDSTIYE
jgi:hypothetical protein